MKKKAGEEKIKADCISKGLRNAKMVEEEEEERGNRQRKKERKKNVVNKSCCNRPFN